MRRVIKNDPGKCVNCNHCIRVCPVDEANIVRELEGRVVTEIDFDKCISCSSCIVTCQHGARYYEDDTEFFFDDLKRGEKISMLVAPAVMSNIKEWGRVFTWLRSLGVERILDASLGTDVCTWAYVRHLEQNSRSHIISLLCPSIVNYALMHKTELAHHLSPVHSPTICAAIYMRKYEGISNKIAFFSPCVAKSLEFEKSGYADYNVTIKHIMDYIEKNDIDLPADPSGFDRFSSVPGNLRTTPGGLRESIENYFGRSIRVDKSDGEAVAYKSLDEYVNQPLKNLPVLFDVRNCADGCNVGTGCRHDIDQFEINTRMSYVRSAYADDEDRRDYLKNLLTDFDDRLSLDDFMTSYEQIPCEQIPVTSEQIEAAFISIGKLDEQSRRLDCGACGKGRCSLMAEQIAKGLNIPHNCMAYTQMLLKQNVDEAQQENISSEIAALEFSAVLSELTKTPEISAGDLKIAAEMIARFGCYAARSSITAIWRYSKRKNALVCIIAYDADTDEMFLIDDYDMSADLDYSEKLFNERAAMTTRIEDVPKAYFAYNNNICAILEAPILVNGQFYGSVSIDQRQCEKYPRGREWTKEEQNFASSLADIMSSAVFGANIRYANKLQEALSVITKSPELSVGLLESTAKLLVEEGCRTLGTNRVGIWMSVPSEERFQCISVYDAVTEEHYIQNDYDAQKFAIILENLKSERLYVVDNISENESLSAAGDKKYPETCALLYAPIRTGGELAGLVCFEQDNCAEYQGERIWAREEQDFVSSIADFMAISLVSSEREKAKNELGEAHETILAGIEYANKIQSNLLPTDTVFKNVFSDYSTIWAPRDVVGGDIYWLKEFHSGSVLCVCDCTGHGTPGALLTMLVVSTLESVVWPSNCRDTANTIWQLEQRLSEVFNVEERTDDFDVKDGCDLAVLFISNDGSVTISAAHTDVYVCNGDAVTRHKGQKMYVGEGKIKDKDDIESIYIDYNPDNRFYIASDGLFDQPGGEKGIPFGYRRFEKIIAEHNKKTGADISEKLWQAFEEYRGAEARVDDFQLVTFKTLWRDVDDSRHLRRRATDI